jgi:hypothetical protein
MRWLLFTMTFLLAACWVGSTERAEDEPTPIEYTAPQCPPEVDAAIRAASAKYGLPRWFYYAVVHRESTFDPNAYRADENGQGLTQLTGAWYNGTPYPEQLAQPDPNHAMYRANMRIADFCAYICPWIDMRDVTPLQPDEWRVPMKNLDRYSSGYAAPMYHLLRARYPGESTNTTLRRLAYHWRYGVYEHNGTYVYPNDPGSYLAGTYGFDQHVIRYKALVEAEDGPFNGIVAKPPYGATHEAETMFHSTGGATPGGWNIWSNGYIETTHNATATTGTIKVYAKGESAAGVAPRMRVAIDGVELGTASVTATAYTLYTFALTTTLGNRTVRITFDNDALINGEDRNLLVDKVVVQ